jgi:hypothetical protein
MLPGMTGSADCVRPFTADPGTSPRYAGSTRTRCCARADTSETKACSSFGRRGITVSGTPERGAVVERARELLRFARAQGYMPDELLEISSNSRDSEAATGSAQPVGVCATSANDDATIERSPSPLPEQESGSGANGCAA